MSSTGIKGISLYRNILRAHARYLPREMRQLGDAYVKAEFRLHTKAKPEQLEGFFAEWDKYLIHVERIGREKQLIDAALIDQEPRQHQHGNKPDQTTITRKKKGFGQDVSPDVAFNDEQKEQLQKLREEAINSAKK